MPPGGSGMVAAIDGLVGEHRCVLGENIDPRLESAVGRLDGKGPVPHAIPTKAVAAGLSPSAFLACLKTLVVSRAARSWRARVAYGMRLDWSGMALAIDDHADVQKDATSSAAASCRS